MKLVIFFYKKAVENLKKFPCLRKRNLIGKLSAARVFSLSSYCCSILGFSFSSIAVGCFDSCINTGIKIFERRQKLGAFGSTLVNEKWSKRYLDFYTLTHPWYNKSIRLQNSNKYVRASIRLSQLLAL